MIIGRIQKGKVLVSILLITSLITTNLFFYSRSIVAQECAQNHADLFYNVQASTITGKIFDSNQLNNLPTRLLELSSEKKSGNIPSDFLSDKRRQKANLTERFYKFNSSVRFDRVIVSNSLFKLFCSFKIPSA
jgi:hypothetical protein